MHNAAKWPFYNIMHERVKQIKKRQPDVLKTHIHYICEWLNRLQNIFFFFADYFESKSTRDHWIANTILVSIVNGSIRKINETEANY